jgi:YHS domain-containing protein
MKTVFSIITFLLLSTTSFSQDMNTRKKEYLLENGVAIEGYDPVSYFSNKPQKGKKEFTFTHEGIVYQFANNNNLAAFKKNPENYEPQYGGWCAYAMGSRGEKVEVDPQTFKILNGKLYLFYHTFFSNTLTDWNKDENSLKSKADNNWKKFIKQ